MKKVSMLILTVLCAIVCLVSNDPRVMFGSFFAMILFSILFSFLNAHDIRKS